MCGITGVFRSGGLTDRDTAALPRMLTRLHHRGPDGSGSFADRQKGVAMGHTRLAIIDLSARGEQPIREPNHDLTLTINGELYDYKVERTRLSCAGERFVTKTDSELALKHYRHDGLDFVNRLRGEFAFALHDGRKRRLVLGRDRFGIRPLYVHVKDDVVVYGSEIKSLLAHPDVPRQLSRKAALHQMMQCMVPGMTAFEGVQALLPGHLMVITDEGGKLRVESHRYWDVDFPTADAHDPNPDPATYIEGVQEQLLDAVRVRLEADVPVGCYLSGGIDSCTILGLGTAMQQSPVKAYTISFDHKAYDEAAIATEMAMSTGADQELLELSADELYGDSFLKTVWHSERTFYNTLGVAKWHMSKRVRESGFKVVLTGEGSDELFGGYPFFKRDYYLHAPERLDGREGYLAQMEESNAVFKGAILAEQQVRHAAFEDLCGFTPSWIQPWMMTLAEARPLLSATGQEELADYDPVAAIAGALDPSQLRDRHPLDRVQYTWIKTMLEGQILNWGGDRVDMANSMESRPPFLDHKLAAFAATIPPALRIREGVEKWVLREAMKNVLPEVLYKREKFAFMAPPGHTDTRKRQAMQALANDHMGSEQVDQAGLFDAEAVSAFLDRYWNTKDAVQGARDDILFNHLLCLHVLDQTLR